MPWNCKQKLSSSQGKASFKWIRLKFCIGWRNTWQCFSLSKLWYIDRLTLSSYFISIQTPENFRRHQPSRLFTQLGPLNLFRTGFSVCTSVCAFESGIWHGRTVEKISRTKLLRILPFLYQTLPLQREVGKSCSDVIRAQNETVRVFDNVAMETLDPEA